MRPSLNRVFALSCFVALSIVAQRASAVIVYDAGADMLANETPDDVTDSANPNFTVPNWSYGHRATTTGLALTLFTSLEHTDTAFFPGLEGFNDFTPIACCLPLPAVYVNTGPPLPMPDGIVGTGEMWLHPDGDNSTTRFSGEDKAVVRFTASIAGTYSVSALWEDIDDCCGLITNPNNPWPGVDVHVVQNVLSGATSTSIFDDAISLEAGAEDLTPPLPTSTSFAGSVTLAVGDSLDFVVGTNGHLFGDTTRFNAVLTLVPEPSSLSLLLFGFLMTCCRRRVGVHKLIHS